LLKGEASNSARLFKVYRQYPNNKHLKAFLAAIKSFNNTETDVLNLQTLEARLNLLLTWCGGDLGRRETCVESLVAAASSRTAGRKLLAPVVCGAAVQQQVHTRGHAELVSLL
jgi:hypothetical protein